MRKLIEYFIKYPVNGNIILVLILIFGYFGLSSMMTTFCPEMESRVALVQVMYPGASPEEVEEGVILKIENNLKGLSGIERISSISNENTGTVTVEIQKGFDIGKVLQDIKNAVDRINSFPVDMEPPVIFLSEMRDFTISLALKGDVSLKILKKYAQKIETDLLALDGISKLTIDGYPNEEISIRFKEDALDAYNLTLDQVVRAIQADNLNMTGGMIKGVDEELLVRAYSKKYTADDLKPTVIKATSDGRIVRLGDVATVTDTWEESPSKTYFNGVRSVVITVNKTISEDLLAISAKVRGYVDEFNVKDSPVELSIVRDGAVILRARIDLLTSNGMFGATLVLVFLALFLNMRLALWVALGIPVSFMGMFMIAGMIGLTINVMSLFGMILVVGILVDDGIVIAENIFSHHERGKSNLIAAIDGTMEVLPAVFSAIMTTVVVFAIFFFLDGRMGEFMSDMAFVVISTLLFSLVEGGFILPAHIAHSKALSKTLKPNKVEIIMGHFLQNLRDKVYKPILEYSIKHKTIALAVITVLLFTVFGAIKGGFIRTTFFPFIDRDNITISIEMDAGTPADITEQRLRVIEEATWIVNQQFKEERKDHLDIVTSVQLSVGPSTHAGSIKIVLLDGESRNLPTFSITSALRKQVGPILGAQKVSYGVGGNFGMPVSISLLGNDFNELQSAKEKLKADLSELSAIKDIVDNDQQGLREVKITLKDKAYLLGLNLRDVVSKVRQGFFGMEVQRLQRGLDEVKVWVNYGQDDRSSIGKLENMKIRMNDGREIPLKEIATFQMERGILGINHLDGKREVRVEAEMTNPTASVTDVMSDIKTNVIPEILTHYPSVSVSYEGQSRQSAKMGASVARVFPIILILMLSIIVFTFRSFAQTLIIFLMLPLGFIGVGLGHFIHNNAISALSAYGILALVGIMVNDALVLVTTFNNLIKEGMPFIEAVKTAALSRFRAILLTSLTTIAGLGPLILEKSLQAQFLIPMAISVAYGLLIATLITLVILPVSIVIMNDLKRLLIRMWTGVWPTPESVEPAYKELQEQI